MSDLFDENRVPISPAGTILGESTKIGILGSPRTGKTVLATKMCYELHLKGVKVFHLGNLAFGEKLDIEFLADQDPNNLRNCIVFLDEIKSVINSRRSGSAFQQLVASNLVQAGHQGVSLIYTTISDSGLERNIEELTEFALWVEGRKHKWTPHPDMSCAAAERRLKQHIHCPAFVPPGLKNHFYKNHADPPSPLVACTEWERRHVVRYMITAQKASPLRTGQRWYKTLHCAQRFYHLSDTTAKIDATAAMMVTSDQIRDQRRQENFQVVSEAASLIAAAGYGAIPLAAITEAIQKKYGIPMPNREVRAHLRDLGVATKTSRSDGVTYQLSEWASRRETLEIEI